MRTVPFKEVVDRVVRLYGRDPRANTNSDLARAVVEHINQRVRVICQCWQWPEWIITEERAFRGVWNADDQYLRASVTDGQPDEVFYIPDLTYYRVNVDASGDPPPGTLPTDPPPGASTQSYFSVIEPVDTFIAYDQRCKRSIGMVLGIYGRNPRVPTGSNNGLYRFMPSERGIDVFRPGNPTVFITYKMPVPRYTMVPYVAGKVYPKSEIVFDPTVGEVFQALTNTNTVPSSSAWRRVPFPEVWANYVVQGAFADSLMEFDQGGNDDIQAKAGMAQYANQNADTFLQVEVDALVAQGQKLRWNFCKHVDSCWCDSQPWSGGAVSTLTDVCEDELGWTYPTPTVVPGVTWQYYNQVVALRATVAVPSLDQIATRYLLEDSLAQIKIIESEIPTLMTWTIVDGPADATNPNGSVNPIDYDAVSNSKHWERL